MRATSLATMILITLTAQAHAQAPTPNPAATSAPALPPHMTVVPKDADMISVTAPFGSSGTVILLDETEETTPSPAPAPVPAIQMREVFFRLSLLGVMIATDSNSYSGGPDFFVGPQIGFYYQLHSRVAAGLDLAYLSGTADFQGKIGISLAPFAQVRLVADLYLGVSARYMLNACGERILFQGGTLEGHLEYIVKDWAFIRASAGGGLHWRNLFDPSVKKFSPAWDGGFTGSVAIGGHF